MASSPSGFAIDRDSVREAAKQTFLLSLAANETREQFLDTRVHQQSSTIQFGNIAAKFDLPNLYSGIDRALLRSMDDLPSYLDSLASAFFNSADAVYATDAENAMGLNKTCGS